MHEGVVSCDSSTTVREAAHMMNENRLRSLVVVDFDCALGGIISETDIVAAKMLNEGGKSWEHLTVGEIMTNRVLTVPPDMSLTEAARVIVDHRIHRVVVTDPDDICNPIGILSLGDIMRYVEITETAAMPPAAPAAKKSRKPAAKANAAKKTVTAAKKKPATKPATKRK
jgi:CBS domain-containing protein